jgi:ribosome-associated protein
MKGDLEITPGVVIPGRCLQFAFARSGGPGGQNVNKVETKVELRFDVRGCDTLSEGQRALIFAKLGNRITGAGELIFSCDVHRQRARNADEVIERFRDALANALRKPKRRVATKPSHGSRRRRLAAKKRRGDIKGLRGKPAEPD